MKPVLCLLLIAAVSILASQARPTDEENNNISNDEFIIIMQELNRNPRIHVDFDVFVKKFPLLVHQFSKNLASIVGSVRDDPRYVKEMENFIRKTLEDVWKVKPHITFRVMKFMKYVVRFMKQDDIDGVYDQIKRELASMVKNVKEIAHRVVDQY